jgi:hypothetical protein
VCGGCFPLACRGNNVEGEDEWKNNQSGFFECSVALLGFISSARKPEDFELANDCVNHMVSTKLLLALVNGEQYMHSVCSLRIRVSYDL